GAGGPRRGGGGPELGFRTSLAPGSVGPDPLLQVAPRGRLRQARGAVRRAALPQRDLRGPAHAGDAIGDVDGRRGPGVTVRVDRLAQHAEMDGLDLDAHPLVPTRP